MVLQDIVCHCLDDSASGTWLGEDLIVQVLSCITVNEKKILIKITLAIKGG